MRASEGLSTASSTLPISLLATSCSASLTSSSNCDSDSEADKVFNNAVTVTNAISLAACISAISAYFVLRRKNPRLMSRISLKLSLAMVCSDTIYHCANFAGYSKIPDGFVCEFVGGWMFTTPTLLSIFYACAIALNTQLVFVHQRVPKDNKQILYLIVPPILAILITTPTLLAGVYGFDSALNFCWFATHNVSQHTVLVRTILTWDLWLFIALAYLIVAVAIIIYSLFKKRGPFAGLAMSKYVKRHPPQNHLTPSSGNPTLATTLARGEIARRALIVRVLGYIITPIICIFPTVIIGLLGWAKSHVNYPSLAVRLLVVITAGLLGTLNTILLAFDPSVVAVVFWPTWEKKEQERKENRNSVAQRQPGRPAPALNGKPSTLGDPDMSQSKTTQYETQDRYMTAIYDHGLELYGHLEVHELSDIDISLTSTIGYNTDELAEIFHGL